MLNEMGVKSGVDWRKLCAVTIELETKLDRRLPSRIAHLTLASEGAALEQLPRR